MKLCWTTIYVSDLEKSLWFYHELLGLEIFEQIETTEQTIVMLGNADDAKLELIAKKDHFCKTGNNSISVGFLVENLQAMSACLEQNGFPVRVGPISPGGSIAFSFFHDPDGYDIQLCQYL
jgi:lactoylglutathione lyase